MFLGLTPAELGVVFGAIVTLVFLEGLLSADNALVLAVMVRHLPREQQKRALKYGIFGAFGFRLIAVLCASFLLDYWIIKVIGGVYLLYLAISHFVSEESDDGGERKSKFGTGFWATVVAVELADIAFSIDSILASVAVAAGLPRAIAGKVLFDIGRPIKWELVIVYTGGVLGIIAMRFVAGYFLKLLEKYPGLETGAYYLIAWIGLKLIGSGFNNAIHVEPPRIKPQWHQFMPDWVNNLWLEMPEWLFWGGMGLIVVVSMLIKPKHHATPDVQPPLTESEILA
jgi:YkoY family integral membrane protein